MFIENFFSSMFNKQRNVLHNLLGDVIFVIDILMVNLVKNCINMLWNLTISQIYFLTIVLSTPNTIVNEMKNLTQRACIFQSFLASMYCEEI